MKKFSSFLVVLLLMLASFTAGVEYQRGDVDQDGLVGISDVTCLIDYLLTGTWSDEPVTPPDTHEYVDLGLPSGTLWATCNVGANAPEENGDYFAWGETEPEDYYDWSTYKWCNDSSRAMTKYCTKSDFGYNGFTDDKTELDPSDDAAYVNWGPQWRIPSVDQQNELVTQCSWLWTTLNGVNGCLITGPNGNSMFLPAAGCRWNDSLNSAGSYGFYWLRSLVHDLPGCAYALFFHSTNLGYESYSYRNCGCPVRAVRVP